ncbi:MAG: hypothetical protein HYT37_00040 [Candidatus Sungbacteria bacterium]|nr:hypothetical protein [Candidatus Sungbacteria bacterium]
MKNLEFDSVGELEIYGRMQRAYELAVKIVYDEFRSNSLPDARITADALYPSAATLAVKIYEEIK